MTSATAPLDLLRQALDQTGASLSLWECHGLLTGWLCADPTLARDPWLEQLLAEGGTLADLSASATETLDALRRITREHLSDPLLGFRPLLPDDAHPLAERTAALGEWCQGYLFGLSLGGVTDLARLPGDSGEVVRDLTELSRAGSYAVEGNEEDEQAYSDLVEFVRAGVLLLRDELQPATAPSPSSTLH